MFGFIFMLDYPRNLFNVFMFMFLLDHLTSVILHISTLSPTTGINCM